MARSSTEKAGTPDGGTPDDAPSVELARRPEEDLAQHAARLEREATISGDPRVRLAAEDAATKLLEASTVPDPLTPVEVEHRGQAVVDLMADGIPDDPADPRWRDFARLTGTPVAEMAAVWVGKDGSVYMRTTGDNVWYVFTGADQPADPQGRRGVAMLNRPEKYKGPFPVANDVPPDLEAGLTTRTFRPPTQAPPGL